MWYRTLSRLWQEEKGATTLEWALLLAGIGLPAVVIMTAALNLLVEYYRLMTFVNSLPFP